MPKSPAIGSPTYAGMVDVSPDHVTEPDWVPADEVDVSRETPAVEDKPKPKQQTKAKAGNAAGKGTSRS